MARSSTTFSDEVKPTRGRGKSFLTKLTDVIRDKAMLEVGEGASKEEAERAFIEHLSQRAFDASDGQSVQLLKSLIDKSYPPLKSALPKYEFNLPENATASQRSEAIMKAVADGDIPADVGALMVQTAKTCLEIEMGSDLVERLESLERQLTKKLEDA